MRELSYALKLFTVEFAHRRTPWLVALAHRVGPVGLSRFLAETYMQDLFAYYHYARRLFHAQRV